MSLAKTLAVSLLFSSSLSFALEPPTASPVLPQSFANWTQTAAPTINTNAADAAALAEYGLTQSATAIYASGPNNVTVHAWQFKDATGAYGAFTFFRQPGMHAETIGHDSASSADHYLFWTGSTVIDATFAHPSADEKAALSALAAQLPQIGGAASVPPSLSHYLPRSVPNAQLDPSTVKYSIGPAAYARTGGQLPANSIDFGLDTEVVTAQYGAEGTLTLLLYPTPQIAGAHLKALDALAKSSGFFTSRAGPIVAVVTGSSSPQSAQKLLASVHFTDYVTINHPEGYVPEGAKLYHLLVGITMIVVVLMSAALLLGIFLGGGRALYRKLRGKPVSTVAEEEFISLHLG
jgi:hypothetical protein